MVGSSQHPFLSSRGEFTNRRRYCRERRKPSASRENFPCRRSQTCVTVVLCVPLSHSSGLDGYKNVAA